MANNLFNHPQKNYPYGTNREKTLKVKIGEKVFAEKKIYPAWIESRDSALSSIRHIWENLIGKTWDEKGGPEIKIDFCGGSYTYNEWRTMQQEKTGIKFFGIYASLEDEDGNRLESFGLTKSN